LANAVRMQGLLTGSRPVAGLLSTAFTATSGLLSTGFSATSGYLRREFELWRWRRAYARRLPPPPRDPREPILEPSIRPAPRWASRTSLRPACERPSVPRRAHGPARRSSPGLVAAPRG
jgi:hypothetical protein